MPATFTIPDDYHYVIASLSLPALVCWWQVLTVIKWRARAKIDYPQMYADRAQIEANKNAHIFNCAQHAQQRMENSSTAITGLEYPILAASVCTFWTLARIPYTLGYLTGDPSKRTQYGAAPGFGCNMIFAPIALFVAGKRLYEAKC
ncbi:hypothetical protein NP233_g4682 [Leucocoprinus birnbaumii]|uniref:Microsomal glutathione S-transferase 3 n=1 Tax=Leucocoprinus birnbaumii TaxID=56174 RepID=A0AAD5VUU3_9AGAR|nr:hypothetical protein NP233_g4682 [Leucocoprinus birnbaumii]